MDDIGLVVDLTEEQSESCGREAGLGTHDKAAAVQPLSLGGCEVEE